MQKPRHVQRDIFNNDRRALSAMGHKGGQEAAKKRAKTREEIILWDEHGDARRAEENWRQIREANEDICPIDPEEAADD